MGDLDSIINAPDSEGRYWLVVKAKDGRVGIFNLGLDGHEKQSQATRHFESACSLARIGASKDEDGKHTYVPCNYHVDGIPRTDHEKAVSDFLTVLPKNYGDIKNIPEYRRMVAIKPAIGDPCFDT
jgi:hypothetical protein